MSGDVTQWENWEVFLYHKETGNLYEGYEVTGLLYEPIRKMRDMNPFGFVFEVTEQEYKTVIEPLIDRKLDIDFKQYDVEVLAAGITTEKIKK